MMRAVVARILEAVGVLTIATALYFWIPLIALAFLGVAVVVLAQSVDGGK